MAEQKKKVIIIGGGFAGVYTARRLISKAKHKLDVELINTNNYFVFQPLLPEVASGTISAQDAVVPLRVLVKGVRIRQAEVVSVDKESKTVCLLQGSRQTLIHIPYDHLVITSGQEANLSFVAGMDAHAMTIKDLSDAYQIRNHILQCLEWADVTINPETKKKLLTFVVAGGGFSGVETIGEIVEMIHRALRYYPNISKQELNPVIVHSADVLLPELHQKLGKYTEKVFKKRGIQVMLGARVDSVTANEVVTNTGERIATATLISSIGNKSPKFVEQMKLALERGKLKADSALNAEGQKNIWCLGDVALIPLNNDKDNPEYAPPTAQFAVQEAKHCADNIVANIENKPLVPFAYKPRGSLASLGSYSGVGEVFGIRVSGIIGWAVWRGFYILKIPGFVTKLRITLNWFYDYFLPRNIVYLEQKNKPSVNYMYFSAGEVIFHQDQLLDGFYMVASGKCQLRTRDKVGQKGFKREIKAGEHFGERLLEQDHALTGDFIAIEDTILVKFEREDFLVLRKHLSGLDDYFSNIDENLYSPDLRETRKME